VPFKAGLTVHCLFIHWGGVWGIR